MGLAYFFLFGMILGAGGGAVLALKSAWEVRKRRKIPAVLLLLLAVVSAAVALYLLMIVWREPPWKFSF